MHAVRSPCFVEGTRLKTRSAYRAVESLREGDILETSLPRRQSVITWIGRRTIDASRHANPAAAWPICIAAHAFGPDQPARDLFVSPNQALYLNQVLIPVRLLVNGGSIRQRQARQVTYWHVVLARHSVVLAEGLATESAPKQTSRWLFAGQPGPLVLHPDFAVLDSDAVCCAPLVVTGPQLDAARTLAAGGLPASGLRQP